MRRKIGRNELEEVGEYFGGWKWERYQEDPETTVSYLTIEIYRIRNGTGPAVSEESDNK